MLKIPISFRFVEFDIYTLVGSKSIIRSIPWISKNNKFNVNTLESPHSSNQILKITISSRFVEFDIYTLVGSNQ